MAYLLGFDAEGGGDEVDPPLAPFAVDAADGLAGGGGELGRGGAEADPGDEHFERLKAFAYRWGLDAASAIDLMRLAPERRLEVVALFMPPLGAKDVNAAFADFLLAHFTPPAPGGGLNGGGLRGGGLAARGGKAPAAPNGDDGLMVRLEALTPPGLVATAKSMGRRGPKWSGIAAVDKAAASDVSTSAASSAGGTASSSASSAGGARLRSPPGGGPASSAALRSTELATTAFSAFGSAKRGGGGGGGGSGTGKDDQRTSSAYPRQFRDRREHVDRSRDRRSGERRGGHDDRPSEPRESRHRRDALELREPRDRNGGGDDRRHEQRFELRERSPAAEKRSPLSERRREAALRRGAEEEPSDDVVYARFARKWGVGENAMRRLKELPSDLQKEVMATFDPAGDTRDPTGKLIAFIKTRWQSNGGGGGGGRDAGNGQWRESSWRDDQWKEASPWRDESSSGRWSSDEPEWKRARG